MSLPEPASDFERFHELELEEIIVNGPQVGADLCSRDASLVPSVYSGNNRAINRYSADGLDCMGP